MELLDYGGNGCVFKSHFKCLNENLNVNREGQLMKVREKYTDYHKHLFTNIFKIDPQQKHFIVPFIDDCDIINYSQNINCNIQFSKPYGYFMTNANGLTLGDYVLKHKLLIMDNIIILVEILHKILLSLKILQDNNIVHGDLKYDNIMITAGNIPIFIDFDLAFYYKDYNICIRDELVSFYPPFLTIIDSNNNNRFTLNNPENPYFIFLKNKLGHIFNINYIKEINKFIQSTNVDHYKNNIIEKNINKIDIFSIGISFIYILEIILCPPVMPYYFKMFLNSMTNVMYEQQYNVLQSINSIERLLSFYAKKGWKKVSDDKNLVPAVSASAASAASAALALSALSASAASASAASALSALSALSASAASAASAVSAPQVSPEVLAASASPAPALEGPPAQPPKRRKTSYKYLKYKQKYLNLKNAIKS